MITTRTPTLLHVLDGFFWSELGVTVVPRRPSALVVDLQQVPDLHRRCQRVGDLDATELRWSTDR